jgi:protein CpxP
MKRHWMKLSAVAALAAVMAMAQTTADPAQPAQPARPGRARMAARRGGFVLHRMVQALGLTDAQKTQAKSIFQAARQSGRPVRQQMMQNRQALSAAVKANDTAQIQSLTSQQGVLAGQLAANRAEAMAKFYAMLTPDQKAKADQMQQKIQQRIQQRQQQHKNG